MKRNKHILFISAAVTVAFIFLNACKKEDAATKQPLAFSHLDVPSGWPAPHYDYSTNKLTEAGFILGRKLFYETKLSKDNSISCGSCHQQASGFSNQGHSLSTGVDGQLGKRNAPAISNLIWQTNFMWTGGVNNIEVMPLSPISNHLEMNETIANAVSKLQNDAQYPPLFNAAFGTSTVNSQLMLKAMAQFTGMLISSHSKYDSFVNGEITLTTNETNGMNLFTQKCASCHPAPLFTNLQYVNFGLDSIFNDPGRSEITGMAADSGKFKVPSLRNVALSYPYMHDGRFATLEQVLDHYSHGIVHSATLSPLLNDITPLSITEKQDIISFLNTLTDETFINDERFKNPN